MLGGVCPTAGISTFRGLSQRSRDIGYAGYLVFEYDSVGSGVPEARVDLEYIKSVC